MPHRLALRHWILALAISASIATLVTSLASAYFVLRQTLMSRATEANGTYAEKVAASIDAYLSGVQRRLDFSASEIARNFQDAPALANEVLRMKAQDRAFQAIYVIDANGRLLASEPPVASDAEKAEIEQSLQRLAESGPSGMSNDVDRASGATREFAWAPLRGRDGQDLGIVAGLLDLRPGGPMNSLIGMHFYHNKANVYVVDTGRRLVYHRDVERIGAHVGTNVAVDSALAGGSGTWRLVNSTGVDVLSGTAPVRAVNWAVVVQEPIEAILSPLLGLMRNVLLWCAPIAMIGLVVVWIGARRIARPLSQLAAGAVSISDSSRAHDMSAVDAWYAEAEALQQALLKEIDQVQRDLRKLKTVASTDPLTGLFNRRAMDDAIAILQSSQRRCAVIAVDIDHFKAVNDNFGHDVGDSVLQKLAAMLRQGFREVEYPCRTGGEEFVVLLPATSLATAATAAERLRGRVAAADFGRAGRVTISLGVAVWEPGIAFSTVLKRADELLYQAKQKGRNRVEAALRSA